jgi:hypothetical protein
MTRLILPAHEALRFASNSKYWYKFLPPLKITWQPSCGGIESYQENEGCPTSFFLAPIDPNFWFSEANAGQKLVCDLTIDPDWYHAELLKKWPLAKVYSVGSEHYILSWNLDVTSPPHLLQIYQTRNIPIPPHRSQRAKYAIISTENMWSQSIVLL